MGKKILVACRQCGKERWVNNTFLSKSYYTGLCQDCARRSRVGRRNPGWKQGQYRCLGYVLVKVYPDDFFYPMVQKRGYVKRSRLVMAKHLGRCLARWEHIHHLNGIKDDDGIENLELTSGSEHMRGHTKGYKDGYRRGLIDGKGIQITRLKQEVQDLRQKLKEIE